MKRILLALLVCFAATGISFSQCPDPSITSDGFHPVSDSLDCIERGVAYDESIQVNIPSSISIAGLASIDNIVLVINSVTGLPNGITSCNTCTINGGTPGCIDFTGTTNDPAGQYPIGFIVTISFNVNAPIGGGPQSFGPQDLNSLLAQLQGLPIPIPITFLDNVNYSLKVIEQGTRCQPLAVSVAANPASVCTGSTTTLTASVANALSTPTFAWSDGGGSNSTATFSPTFSKSYTVTVTDGGETATGSVAVTVNTVPNTTFTVGTSNPVTIFNATTGATTWSWNFGDNSAANTSQNPPAHTYTANGNYTITLIATNSCGADTATQQVSISGVFINPVKTDNVSLSLYPNPNTGSFEVNLISKEQAGDYTLRIFDLKGEIVYSEAFTATGSKIQKSLQLEHLDSGIYTVNLNSISTSYIQKLVIY